MKKYLYFISILVSFGLNGCSDASDTNYTVSEESIKLNVQFADTKWDGKTIPKDEVCLDYNKNGGSSPSLTITNLPSKTDYILFSYSDETYKPMSNGGHGVLKYILEKEESRSNTITIPSVKGQTFDLPTGFISIKEHRVAKKKKAGAYLPPCSGGHGNLYTVFIRAMQQPTNSKNNAILLGDANLSLGRY